MRIAVAYRATTGSWPGNAAVAEEQASSSTRPIHIAFFREASTYPDQSPEYNAILAGLLTLRLLDKWAVPGQDARSAGRLYEFSAVRRSVRAMPDGAAKDLLRSLVSAINAYVSGRADERLALVIDYARLLERDSYWTCASDTYETAIAMVDDRALDRSLLPQWYQRAAYCRRQAGDVRGAEPLLLKGQAVANELHDVHWWFRLRIAMALLELQRGNLGESEKQLDRIIADAKRSDLPEIVARATHDRGQVAYAQNQDHRAATLYFDAMMMHTEMALARRAALDLAVALGDLGHLPHALKVCRILRNGPEDGSDIRTIAGINLMRLSHLGGDEAAFDRLYAELRDERMTGRLRAHFLVTAAQGLKRFGRTDEAREAAQQALEVAERYHVHKLVTDATTLLGTGEDVHRNRTWKEDGVRPNLTPIFEAIDANRGPLAGAVSA
jgi:tetratricopeptide (TPR) repeat protein